MSVYPFVDVDQFTPNSRINWISVGKIASVQREQNRFTLKMPNGLYVVYSVISASSYRIWFSPKKGTDFSPENSCVTVAGCADIDIRVLKNDAHTLSVDQGDIRVDINLDDFALSVYRDNQLIHADQPGYSIVYIPGEEVIANVKQYPNNARSFGFGEKAGKKLDKRGESLTFFNYDNFGYFSTDNFGQSLVPPNTPNGDDAPFNAAAPLYQTSPFLMEVNPHPTGAFAGDPYAYGIFFDNWAQSYMNFGRGQNMEDQYYFGALYGNLDYYFFYGEKPANVIDEITHLTGRTLLKPKYALGFQQGCYGYNTRSKLETVAKAYRDHQIPCDGLHIDVDVQDQYQTFTTSEQHFPDIKGMFADLHAIGFKCATNITPLVCNINLQDPSKYPALETGLQEDSFIYNTRDYNPPNPERFIGAIGYGNDPYGGQLGASGFYPDFGRLSVRQWWGQQYKYLLDAGLEMIWQDMTVPSLGTGPMDSAQYKSLPMDIMMADSRYPESEQVYRTFSELRNIFSFNLVRATYEHGLEVLRPNKRNFIISRGGFLGVHRYAGLWTGDSASSWEFLRINIPIVLNMGLSGQPLSGSDVGGFTLSSGSYGRAVPDPHYSNRFDGHMLPSYKQYGGQTKVELFVRWMTQGAFLPWYRNHYNGYQKIYQEPYKYPEPVKSICKKYIELRYRLIQLFYDAMYENTQTGMPICRALFLNEDDPGVFCDVLSTQFFVGKDLLVAPIVEEHGNDLLFEYQEVSKPVRDIYLPAGSSWYDFNEGTLKPFGPVAGGQVVKNYYAPLDPNYSPVVPVYVREGAIIPFRELEQWIGQLSQNQITLRIYPGKASTYTMYLDDNGVTNNAEKHGTYRLVNISNDGAGTVSFEREHDEFTPPEECLRVQYIGIKTKPSSVDRDGSPLIECEFDTLVSQKNAWSWDTENEVVTVSFVDDKTNTSISII